MQGTLSIYLVYVGILSLANLSPFPQDLLAPLALLFLLLSILRSWRALGIPIAELGFHLPAHWGFQITLAIFIGILFPSILFIFETSFGWAQFQLGTRPFSQLAPILLPATLRIFLVVLVEELAFRGFFLQRLISPWRHSSALIVASSLWAFSHLPSMLDSGLSPCAAIIGFASLLLLGIALGIGFLKTAKSLWVPIALHLGYNLSHSIVGTLWESKSTGSNWLLGHPPWTPESGLLGLLLNGLILIAVWWGFSFAWGNSSGHRENTH
jgi:membrane protease YdiL (CAAX protease family)